MTDREQIIAAALESGFVISIFRGQEPNLLMPASDYKTLKAFYAIAFEAGAASRGAEIAGVVAFMRDVARNTSDHTTTDVIDEYLAKVRKP